MSDGAGRPRSLLQRLLDRPGEEPLLAGVAVGGARFRRLVLTRNRRVMISVGDRGRTLRLHQCFREAPPEVLRAVGTLLSTRDAEDRAAARAVVRRFLADRAPPGEPAQRRNRRGTRGDPEAVRRLREEFDRVNREHFGGALPAVPISLSGRMRRRNGHFCADPVEIVLSRALCRDAEAGEAEQTLRHEMIHLWQHVEGRKPGHGADFRRWAVRLGVRPRATRDVRWKGGGGGAAPPDPL